ncbi:hypothetical protein PIB30_000068 [Stylosanthes scabra]|uniref:F-box domain-containing protein n=1 Tax=Stylosanthes scabra TaxID=79078 RepID=A0ABU6Q223_9FABA|nr:hypothetical protein [Stylosanthes scabra]
MTQAPPASDQLPNFDEEILWKIFCKADPKTATRCRVLSKMWKRKLTNPLFVKHNFRENKERNMQVVVSLARTGRDDECFSMVRVDMQTRQQCEGKVPESLRQFSSFEVIGSSHGLLCVRFILGNTHSELAVWNPLTKRRISTHDPSGKQKDFNVSQNRVPVEEKIPQRAKSTFHTLCIVKDEVAFVSSFYTSQFTTVVDVYQVTLTGSSGSKWGKLFRIPKMSVPFTPTLFAGKYLLNVMESRSGPYNSNDAERTDLLIAKHDYEADRSTNLLSTTWTENVHLRNVSLHSPGIYPVEKLT